MPGKRDPESLNFDKSHNWIELVDDTIVFGITPEAISRAQQIVFLELPEQGKAYKKGEACGHLESAKWSGEIIMPVTGEIIELNEKLADSPEMLNEDAYEAWIAKIKPEKLAELDSLMDFKSYKEFLKSE